MNPATAAKKIKRKLSSGSLAALSFGVILAGFSAAPAQALTVNSGTDYLRTPGAGANFVFDPPSGPKVAIPYSGLPILTPTPIGSPNGGFTGSADTVVNRLSTVTATPSGGVTPLEVVGLSLFATNVTLPSGGIFDTVAGLQKYYGNTNGGGPTSDGTMTIRNNFTWDSDFTVKAVAFFAAPGTLGLDTKTPDLVRNIIGGITTPADPSGLYACDSGTISGMCLLFDKRFVATNQLWATTPLAAQLIGDNLVSSLPQNFYVSSDVPHDAGDGTIHTVEPVPGPLPVLGIGAAFSFSRRLRRKCRTAAKSA